MTVFCVDNGNLDLQFSLTDQLSVVSVCFLFLQSSSQICEFVTLNLFVMFLYDDINVDSELCYSFSHTDGLV